MLEKRRAYLLTAVIWSWFAAAESHNRLSQNQAQVIENPGLSYGLFHAVADPIYSWGVVRKVTFPGVNMDIGHVRNITWAKDNDEKKWVAYNRLRGQYMSGLEHAVPELLLSEPSWCNSQRGAAQTVNLPDCPRGISATRALAIAAAQGQKIYTITQKVYDDNPNIVSANLGAHSYDTQNRVQQSLDAGYEVTIHESPIAESGWTGAGYAATDSTTGAGAYTIEGGANGGVFNMPIALPVCAGFWSSLWTNFVETNAVIPGLALPVGVTLLTGSFVVDALGGITFLKIALNWSALVSAWLIGPAIIMAVTVAIINFVLMSLAFELGILIGSAAVAASNTCRRE